jgi:site-specific recombinase XerD
MPGFHAGRPPRNKGLRYPADPPKVGEIIAVMRATGDDAHGRPLRGLIAILWRAGLRIQEALDLSEADLDQRRGELLVRSGRGRPASRGRHGRLGMGTAAAMARAAAPATRRAAALRHQRSDTRAALVERRGTNDLRRTAASR